MEALVKTDLGTQASGETVSPLAFRLGIVDAQVDVNHDLLILPQ